MGKGPPYLNDPHATFLVISHPWGQTPKKQAFVNAVGAWVRFMPRTANNESTSDILVNRIYTRKTEDIVIVELPENIPLSPYLGEHRWNEFLRPDARPKSSKVSLIFEYNYRNNGDPSNHNWMEEYPTADLPPSLFPVLVPYPPPQYAAQTNTLIYLTKPMPSPPPRRTQPQDLSVKSEVAEDRKPIIKTEDAPSYKPQDELLTLVAAYNATRTDSGATASTGQKPGSHLVKSEIEDLKPSIKSEEIPGYEPQRELRDLVSAYNMTRGRIQPVAYESGQRDLGVQPSNQRKIPVCSLLMLCWTSLTIS